MESQIYNQKPSLPADPKSCYKIAEFLCKRAEDYFQKGPTFIRAAYLDCLRSKAAINYGKIVNTNSSVTQDFDNLKINFDNLEIKVDKFISDFGPICNISRL